MGGGGGLHPTGYRGWEGCAPGARLVEERGPRPLGLAHRLLLPSCAGEEEELSGGERWRPGARSQVRARRARPRKLHVRAVLLSSDTGKFMLLASTFRPRATAGSEERTPGHQAKSLARARWALFWPITLGVGSSLSITQGETDFGVLAPDPKLARKPSIFF